MSKIYLVERDESKNTAHYDVFNNHVVIAKSPKEARELAMELAADEGEESWLEAKVTVIGDPKVKKSRLILSDFNAG